MITDFGVISKVGADGIDERQGKTQRSPGGGGGGGVTLILERHICLLYFEIPHLTGYL